MAAPERPPVVTASRSDWQDVFSLLDTALDLAPDARAAWLAALSPEQSRLTPLLRQLLQAQADISTSDFQCTPPCFMLAPPPVGALLVAQALVGPYRLLREIGQGGMASV